MSDYNIWLSPMGGICTKPSKDKLINRKLAYIEGISPIALSVVSSDRRVLQELYNNTSVKIEPSSKTKIHNALGESKITCPPLRPLTRYEMVGMIDELGILTASKSPSRPADLPSADAWPVVTKGKQYKFKRIKYSYTRPLSRNKMHNDKEGGTYVAVHDIERSGVDAGYVFIDDNDEEFVFRDNPISSGELISTKVWQFFDMPKVKTIAELRPKQHNSMLKKLEIMEDINTFKFYPGQKDYIARVACVDEACVCGDVGTGKTLIAIALMGLKNAKRVLMMGPKGTVMDSSGNSIDYDPAQWVEEVERFSPDVRIYNLFSKQDLLDVQRSDGSIPPGLYITYPNAFLLNNSFESIPKAWALKQREQKFRARLRDMGFDAPYDVKTPPTVRDQWHRGVGATRNGFTCMVKPSLCTLSKDNFDMVMLDEAHVMQNLDSQVTSTIIRMQPKYRYALTATPIGNMLPNIFPILGWLAVPNWYHGEQSNTRWPYTIEQLSLFESTFLTSERDYTEESIRGGGYYSAKPSPIISQAQRLLKVLKSLVAFISKEECNPDVVDCVIEKIRVPLGYQQKKLYSKNLDIANIPFISPKIKYGVQLQRLRGICSEPLGRNFNDGIVGSNFNPKLIMTLELIAEALKRKEQIIHVSSSVGQTTEILKRLNEANIKCSRIDSKAKYHVREANNFKNQKTPVLLMGSKCAVGHSFPKCNNMIIGSFDWSYGAFHQAIGRIYRVNSSKDANIKVLLNQDTVEESMFEKLADKRDAATICLHGEYVPANYQNADASEVLADHFLNFNEDLVHTENELNLELKWTELRLKLSELDLVSSGDVKLACV